MAGPKIAAGSDADLAKAIYAERTDLMEEFPGEPCISISWTEVLLDRKRGECVVTLRSIAEAVERQKS
jgi:hypothetical protein